MPYNFNECAKGSNPTKDKAREISVSDLTEILTERYGADSVSLVDSNMLAVCLGTRTLSDGTIGEVCVTIEVVAKDFDIRIVESSGKTFQPYQRIKAEEDYEFIANQRKEKAEQKAREKAEQKAREKAEREAKKKEAVEERKAQKEQNRQEILGDET